MTKKTLDEIIDEALKDVPEFPNYSVAELAEITDERWLPSRWHVEILEARGVVEHLEQGREKLRRLKQQHLQQQQQHLYRRRE